MKTCYLDMAHRAIADLVEPNELTPNWTITRINVPAEFRGNGYGTALLKLILADADSEGATLQLEVLSSGPLNYDELVAWYVRHGFQQASSGHLERVAQCR